MNYRQMLNENCLCDFSKFIISPIFVETNLNTKI